MTGILLSFFAAVVPHNASPKEALCASLLPGGWRRWQQPKRNEFRWIGRNAVVGVGIDGIAVCVALRNIMLPVGWPADYLGIRGVEAP